jgi:putative restriction endonuclease
VVREINVRRGQPHFRETLLRAYKGQCCVTGSAVLSVLEAAHIVPHSEGFDYSIRNGLLLRADTHTLFDLGHLEVDAEGRVLISVELNGTEHAALAGKLISKPRASCERP